MQKNIQNESGRSMVEILGVLAIIGVLSVGGIAGYRTAMDSHHASQTIDRIMKRAVTVSSAKLLGQTASLDGFDSNDGVYAITLTNGTTIATPTFEMTVAHVPQKVCEKIKSYDWKLPSIWPKKNCSNINDMQFIFSNDLTNTPSPTDCSSNNQACTGCQTCENGMCVDNPSQCPNDSTCTNGKCVCQSGFLSCGTTCCMENHLCASNDSYAGIIQCQPVTGSGCIKNEDCDSVNEYCDIPKAKCNNLKTGTCLNKPSLISILWNNKTFFISTQQMSVWSAENLCLSHGKQLASLGSIGIALNYKNTSGLGPLYQGLHDANIYEISEGEFWTSNSPQGCRHSTIFIQENKEEVMRRALYMSDAFALCE